MSDFEEENFVHPNLRQMLMFFVNGKKVVEPNPDPEWTLLWYLRRKLRLTGSKYGCGEGGCGACTVMVSQYLGDEKTVKHIAVNACLMPICAVHGLAVTTIEGIGSTADRLHPVQERLAKAHGSQCGFCTPGIVMSMYTLLRNRTFIECYDIEMALQGNLCRCTGYRPIIEAFKTFVKDWESHTTHYVTDTSSGVCLKGDKCCRNKDTNGVVCSNSEVSMRDGLSLVDYYYGGCPLGDDCCRNKVNADSNSNTDNDEDPNSLFNTNSFKPYDSSQEPIFPPELKLHFSYTETCLCFQGPNVSWIRPATLDQLLRMKDRFPESKIVVGNTEVGIEVKFKKKMYTKIISPVMIREMTFCYDTDLGVVIGAATTLSDVVAFLGNIVKRSGDKGFMEIINILRWFASEQIRNVASLVGNIITASPISDLIPILMASSATIVMQSWKRGMRKVLIDEKFFKGYRKTVMEDDEVVLSVEIPYIDKGRFIKAYKQSRRKDDDISIVTAAFNLQLDATHEIFDLKLCFGGMGPMCIFERKTARLLEGCKWDEKMFCMALESLTKELQLHVSSPGGMAEYRKSLCISLFFKFFLDVFQYINGQHFIKNKRYTSAIRNFSYSEPQSSQCFEVRDNMRKRVDAVGRPLIHASALKQATGEAIYCDDITTTDDDLYLALVFSSEPFAKIISVDASECLNVPGVVQFFSAADLDKDRNQLGPIFKDEEIFSREMVTSRACVIGAVVAKSEAEARMGKHLVNVKYEPLQPIIVTLEDAIKHKSFFPNYPRILQKGNVEEAFQEASHMKEGYVRCGAQEHFYLETISAYAHRKEDELEIVATTQNPAEIAQLVSQAIGIPNHKVIAKVKRIGGGFGGKETRAAMLAIPVAIAAYALRKPVRAVLDRDEDMQVTGYRHPCLSSYKVTFDDVGQIKGAMFKIYSNAGYSMDISCSMMERAIAHVDNCYRIPNIYVEGYVCKTNLPSNTAFRGFGAPQAMLVAETIIRDIALTLGKTYEEVAQVNIYKEGDLTHFNQPLAYCTLSRCWNECVENSDYKKRKTAVKLYNKCNRFKKKGIALVPTKYGISFQVDVLMQGGALVLVYTDGSVLLSIGGIEMGQGLFTKMAQVASRALDIDVAKIHISEMSTDKVPNSSPTAGSVSSDLYGMAIINACDILLERLAPYKLSDPNGNWESWVSQAYVDRVNLSASGFYAAPKIEYNPETNSGNLYEYFTYGVACSEVVIDTLTGEHKVLRTDVVMDIGESLNPAIDIGQIEGAFMQGYGYYTMEEMLFSPKGEVLSRGPGTYKIPAASDIPSIFNVSLLKGAPNPRAVYSSKAVGEPPLFLASSVYFALKEAITSARLDSDESPNFILNPPATCEKIRMACVDGITKKVLTSMTEEGGEPWNVTA